MVAQSRQPQQEYKVKKLVDVPRNWLVTLPVDIQPENHEVSCPNDHDCEGGKKLHLGDTAKGKERMAISAVNDGGNRDLSRMEPGNHYECLLVRCAGDSDTEVPAADLNGICNYNEATCKYKMRHKLFCSIVSKVPL
ncbi:hypothetical protein Ancab_031918 [Ancistrocladus abbreviatus]